MSAWAAINLGRTSGSPQRNAKRTRNSSEDTSDLDASLSQASSSSRRKIETVLQETEEALEARLTASYEDALRSHSSPEIAISMYVELLQFISTLKSMTSITTRKILYLCLKNLAQLEANSSPPLLNDALEHYAAALEIDDTDFIVWYNGGCIAFQLQRYALARMMFEKAVNMDATFWPLLLKLSQTLYILQDDEECLKILGYILKHDPTHDLAAALKATLLGDTTKAIKDKTSMALKALSELRNEVKAYKKDDAVVTKLVFDLTDNTWNGLGCMLLEVYGYMTEKSNEQPCSVSLTHSPVKIRLALPEKSDKSEINCRPSIDVDFDIAQESNTAIHIDLTGSSPTAPEPGNNTEDNYTNHEETKEPSSDPISPSTNSRRTSHRTIKRLQEEQEAAIKFAKEKDLSYRLKSFLNLQNESPEINHFLLPVRVTKSDDRKCLTVAMADEENVLPLIVETASPENVARNKILHHNTPKELPIDLDTFLQKYASGERNIEMIMINYVELCADNFQVSLGDDVIKILRWVYKCITQELKTDIPISCGTSAKLSTKARLFMLEIEVDSLIVNFDPLHHSKLDFIAALSTKYAQLLQLMFDDCSSTLLPRCLWLQIQMDEHTGFVEKTTSLLNDLIPLVESDIILGNIKKFPLISITSIQGKMHNLQLATLEKAAQNLLKSMDEKVDDKILELVLHHYDPDSGKAGHIEELVVGFRVHLRHAKELKVSEQDPTQKLMSPLLSILVKSLYRLQNFQKCFKILVLGLYFTLCPTTEKVALTGSTIQCVKYLVAQINFVIEHEFNQESLYINLLDYCCFECRDVILSQYQSASLLEKIIKILSPCHITLFLGKIVDECKKIDLRSKSSQKTASILQYSLEKLNQILMVSVESSSRVLTLSLAKSLSFPIITALKHQIDVGKFKSTTRRLLYASCSAFALIWYDTFKGTNTSGGDLVSMLHDIVSTGDGLSGHGTCSMSCNGYNFLEILKRIILQAPENCEEELAQIYFCLHGYGILATCINHHGENERKRTKSKPCLMELLKFCQNAESKLARKECYTLFENILELPETKQTLRALIPSNEQQVSLEKYMNPVSSKDVHSINPIEWTSSYPINDNELSELWYDLATNFHLPKVKRRGRDYQQFVSYEVQCLKFIDFLRNDISLHPNRAESYHEMANCVKNLRSLIVDHWTVAWLNFNYPLTPPEQLMQPLDFEKAKTTPFFKQFVKWIEKVQNASDDDEDQRDVNYSTREIALFYTQYVAVLAELQFRCLDMAAKYDNKLAADCYEDAGTLAWNLISEKSCEVFGLCTLGTKYFQLALADNEIDNEARLRLNYMLGRLAKKMVSKDVIVVKEWREILNYFHNGEMYRQIGELESLPHAFYQLHACRLKLLLHDVKKNDGKQPKQSIRLRVDVLALINDYFYVKKSAKQRNDTDNPSTETSKELITQLLQDENSIWLAKQHLLGNCLDALENIPSEDRYFHPAYYSFAWGLRFGQAIIDETNEYWREKCCVQSALKAMKPLFDRKRPQVVAVWLSESDTHKLEELHQNQKKYDRLRLKYFSFYLELMTLANDSQRVHDLTGWVMASKEDHYVIDLMLLEIFHANCYLARGKLLDLYMKCLFPGQEETNFQQRVLSYLNRMYTLHIEYIDVWHRVKRPNTDTMGNWIWEVAMSYALYAVVHEQNIQFCEQAVAHVEKNLIQYSQSASTRSESHLLELYEELKMEEQTYWATLVDEALQFCSIKWPDKVKTKPKAQPPRSKLRFLLN